MKASRSANDIAFDTEVDARIRFTRQQATMTQTHLAKLAGVTCRRITPRRNRPRFARASTHLAAQD